MTFPSHPSFQPPDSPDQIIWCYIDFTKLVSMLDRQALYFVNLEKLSRTDAFEGVLPKNFYKYRDWTTISDVPSGERAQFTHSKTLIPDEELAAIKSAREHYAKTVWAIRKSMFVNCWHLNDSDSPAMWSIYTNRGSGIAIASTYEKLERSLAGVT